MVLLRADALLIDCDGVLVDSDDSVRSAWTAWLERYGLDPGIVDSVVHGRRRGHGPRPGSTRPGQQEAIAGIDELELAGAGDVRAVPGSLALTRSLPVGRWAVVTSGNDRLARARLAAAGHAVPAVAVTADVVAVGKPDPEGYLLAASRLGVPVERCVVLEDSASGVEAGRAAGVSAVLGIGERALATDADLVVADLTDVRWTAAGLEVAPGLMEALIAREDEGMAAPRKYPDELRERATRMAVDARRDPATRSGALRRIGEQLGINPETLRNWVVQAEVDAGERPGVSTEEARRIAELERENRELRRANEILRTASAFFAAAELDRRLK